MYSASTKCQGSSKLFSIYHLILPSHCPESQVVLFPFHKIRKLKFKRTSEDEQWIRNRGKIWTQICRLKACALSMEPQHRLLRGGEDGLGQLWEAQHAVFKHSVSLKTTLTLQEKKPGRVVQCWLPRSSGYSQSLYDAEQVGSCWNRHCHAWPIDAAG